MKRLPPLLFFAPLNSDPVPALQAVEIASSLQIPSFHIVGLPGPEVAEARERVKAAIEAAGFEFPRRRVILNLSPASVRKQGTGLDLPMALAVLHEAEHRLDSKKSQGDPLRCAAWAELGLDGTLKPTGQITRALCASFDAGVDFLILPEQEARDASDALDLIERVQQPRQRVPRLLFARCLTEAWENLLVAALNDSPIPRIREMSPERESVLNLAATDQTAPEGLLAIPASLERILGIASAGAHHLLLLGPRGTGKTHALEWLVSIQAPARPKTLLERKLLAELVCRPGGSWDSPGYRRVGVHARPQALIGSAQAHRIRPGEFSLAHGGLLLADELPEWPRDSRESLREPMERGSITLTRAQGAVELPARFALAANGNLCPCGGVPSELQGASPSRAAPCICDPSTRQRYLSRLSGPVLDRIDLVIQLGMPGGTPNSADTRTQWQKLREKVASSREEMISRWGAPPGRLDSAQLESLLRESPKLLEHRALQEAHSLRSRHKLLRIAMSLACWDGSPAPTPAHLTEASLYRCDRFVTK